MFCECSVLGETVGVEGLLMLGDLLVALLPEGGIITHFLRAKSSEQTKKFYY